MEYIFILSGLNFTRCYCAKFVGLVFLKCSNFIELLGVGVCLRSVCNLHLLEKLLLLPQLPQITGMVF